MPPQVDGLAPYAANVCAAYQRAEHSVHTIDTARGGSPRSLGLTKLPGQIRLLRRHRPQVLHVQHTISAYGTRLPLLWTLAVIARGLGAEVIVTHHEVTRDIARLRLPGRIYYRLVSRIARLNHVHTQESATALHQRCGTGEAATLVFPHPVFESPAEHTGSDPAETSPVAPAETSPVAPAVDHPDRIAGKQLLLHFGFIHVEKGIDCSIAAYAELLRRRPDLKAATHLVVAGEVRRRPTGFARFESADRAYAESLPALVARHGIQDQVTFVGRVPDSDVDPWLRAAALVLLPYERIEQSGVANLAVAAETPVLATPLGGFLELLSGLPMIDDRAPQPYSEVLEAALDDLPRLRQLARETYARARRAGSVDQLVADLLAAAGVAPEVATDVETEAA